VLLATDEVARGIALLRSMSTGEQTEVSIEQLIADPEELLG
jgi:histidyl-tRNA synthetase